MVCSPVDKKFHQFVHKSKYTSNKTHFPPIKNAMQLNEKIELNKIIPKSIIIMFTAINLRNFYCDSREIERLASFPQTLTLMIDLCLLSICSFVRLKAKSYPKVCPSKLFSISCRDKSWSWDDHLSWKALFPVYHSIYFISLNIYCPKARVNVQMVMGKERERVKLKCYCCCNCVAANWSPFLSPTLFCCR